MKFKLSKSEWEDMGKNAGWMKKAQFTQQQPKQMLIFNQNYQGLMRALNALNPDVQNQASAAFSDAFNSLQAVLADPNSWME